MTFFRRLHRSILLLLVGIVALLGYIGYHYQATVRPEAPSHEESAGLTGTLITGIRLEHTEADHAVWSLTATQAQRTRSGRTLVRTPHLTIFRENAIPLEVSSLAGEVDEESHAAIFSEDVHVIDGERELTTEILRFDPETEKLFTEESFRLSGKGMWLDGVGMNYFGKTGRLQVEQRVRFFYDEAGRDGE